MTKLMIKSRKTACRSLIRSKSTHNKCIESLWRDVYNGVTGLYHELFSLMEDEENLDSFNEFDLVALHLIMCFCFLLMTSLMPDDRHGPIVNIQTIKTSPI